MKNSITIIFMIFIKQSRCLTALGKLCESESTFNRQEIFCDVAYFYKLIDFNDVMQCYENTKFGSERLTPNLMSGLFGDALLGYMRRDDLVGKADEEALKWATQTVKELKGGRSYVAAGHMLHAALRLWKYRPTPLLEKFLKAMITIRLSGVLYWTIGTSKPKDLYSHLINNGIGEEHFFIVGITGHGLLASFRHIGQDKADVAYINSGDGLERHPQKFLLASQHTETTPVKNVEIHPDDLFHLQFIRIVLISCLLKMVDLPMTLMSSTSTQIQTMPQQNTRIGNILMIRRLEHVMQ